MIGGEDALRNELGACSVHLGSLYTLESDPTHTLGASQGNHTFCVSSALSPQITSPVSFKLGVADSVEWLDLESESWQFGPELQEARLSPIAAFMDDLNTQSIAGGSSNGGRQWLFVAGGSNGGMALKSAEVRVVFEHQYTHADIHQLESSSHIVYSAAAVSGGLSCPEVSSATPLWQATEFRGSRYRVSWLNPLARAASLCFTLLLAVPSLYLSAAVCSALPHSVSHPRKH